jgi:rod shape-determining protein MreC
MIELLKRFRLLFIALLFLFPAFLVLTLNVRDERKVSLPERVLLQISLPVQQRAQGALLWVRGVGEQYIFLTQVQQENQDLKRTVSALREENNRLKEALWTEERLKKLSYLQSQYSSVTVVTSDGVVGRVIEVSLHTAKVLLITDPNSAMDVIVQRSRTQGIMEGKVEEVCVLKYVQKNEDVQVGDKVITSGLGGIFPKGLMTGTVTRVERKRPGIFQYIEVTPSVDFSRLEEVLILKGES